MTAIIDRFASKKILVIGDLILDEFVWGKVSRISPEAPVPVVNVVGESYYAGGAGNVARNLMEFTSHVTVMGVTGTDAFSDRLLDLLQGAGIDTRLVQRCPNRLAILKSRIIARNQQVVRIDREQRLPLTPDEIAIALHQIDEAAPEMDAIIVADYGKGFVQQLLVNRLIHIARETGKILAADPNPRNSLTWDGVTAIKPNRGEAFMAAGMPVSEPVDPVAADAALFQAGHRLLNAWNTGVLLITLGEQGMLLFQPHAEPYHTPTRAREVFDVSGAGDTAIALFTLSLCAGATPIESAEIANHASGIAVGKLGTATVTAAELKANFGQ